jgi:hypothetical protein
MGILRSYGGPRRVVNGRCPRTHNALQVAPDPVLVRESAIWYTHYSGELVDLANKPSAWERMSLWSRARRFLTISGRRVARA